MDIQNVTKNISFDNLSTKEGRILHIVPDFKSNIINVIKSIGVKPNSLQAIVSRKGIVKIASKSFDSTPYTNQLKNLLEQRKIDVPVYSEVPNNISASRFVVIDHSMLSQAVAHISEISSEKQALYFLFQSLKQSFKEIQSKNPGIKQSINFVLNKYEKGLIQLLSQLEQISKPDLIDYNAFDDYVFITLTIDENNVLISPIAGFDLKGNVEIYKGNVGKSETSLKNTEKEQLKKTNIEKLENSPNKNIKISSVATKVQGAVEEKVKSSTDNILSISSEVDPKKLKTILKDLKIKDGSIANNIKEAVDKYISKNKNIDKDDLENVVLKAIHFSLYQTDKLRTEFLADPALLIKKLTEVNTHSKILDIPSPRNLQLIDPKKMIDLTAINSIRSSYEFDENLQPTIEALFKSLETKKNLPIKILSIKHEYKDDNINRYMEYNIKIKNTSGGTKEPYELKLKIPSLVNDRYLKLNGSEYIFLNQQFLAPLTKDRDNEARFLTHFQMTRLSVKNLKYNISQIEDIINYIDTKYPELIVEREKTKTGIYEYVKFRDGTIITPRGEVPFQRFDKTVERKNGKFIIKKRDLETSLSVGLNEFLFQELSKQIISVNPSDTLSSSKRAAPPYIQANILSRKIPLVLFLWQQQGLIETLVKLGIDFEIGKTSTKNLDNVSLKLEGNESLFIYPENKRQELIVNGILQLPKTIKLSREDLSDRYSLDSYLNEKHGSRTCTLFDMAVDKMIDPTTAKLLEFNEFPKFYLDILTEPLLDKLLNDQPDHPADLKNLRVRGAEVFAHLMYNQISMAHNYYIDQVNAGNGDAKIRFDENYIINNLMGKHRDARDDGGQLLEFVKTSDFIL